MDDSQSSVESKGWQPPLFIEFILPAALLSVVVSKYEPFKQALISSPEAAYYTVIGLLETFFDS